MKRRWNGFTSVLAAGIVQFLAHKRALGRRYRVEEAALRLFDRFLGVEAVTTIDEITPALVDAFLRSRPRIRPRSYNHLRGALARCFDWLVIQGQVPASPVQAPFRRVTGHRIPFIFDQLTAKRLLDLAATLPDNARAPHRGATYRVVFALLYGLGLRVGEVSRR